VTTAFFQSEDLPAALVRLRFTLPKQFIVLTFSTFFPNNPSTARLISSFEAEGWTSNEYLPDASDNIVAFSVTRKDFTICDILRGWFDIDTAQNDPKGIISECDFLEPQNVLGRDVLSAKQLYTLYIPCG
jgi:hypothetical protein